MKKFKYLLIMIIALTVSVSSCSDDDDPVNALVGTWEYTDLADGEEYNLSLTFKENLTGTALITYTFEGETESGNESFTWSTDRNKLTLIIEGETEMLTYSISGNKLTLTFEDDDPLVFTRQ